MEKANFYCYELRDPERAKILVNYIKNNNRESFTSFQNSEFLDSFNEKEQ